MADGIVVVQPDSTGKKIDTSELTVGANTVERQRIVISDSVTAAAVGSVLNSQPAGTEYGIVVREAQKGQATMANSQPVVIASDQSTINVFQPGATATGSITGANQTPASLNVQGYNSFAVDIRGTWTGQIVPEVSVDGTNFMEVDLWDESAETWLNSPLASVAPGMWWFEPLGTVKAIRIRSNATAWTGTATYTLIAGMGDMNTPEFVGAAGATPPNNVAQVGGLDATGNVLRTLAVDASGRAFSVPHDGTNKGTIKAASTAPVATDTALVVAVSPNTPAVKVDGSAVTQPISAAALPLPTGAATAAKQPALGTAGTASTDVITVQGITGMTAVKVDGSGVTQPISGSVTVSGTVAATQSGTWTVNPGNTANTTPWLVSQTPATSGGLSVFHVISSTGTNQTNLKASAGQVFGWYIYNASTAARFVAFHNTAAAPTAGAGVLFKIGIPAGAAANVFTDSGVAFSTGIGITTVVNAADNDATGVTSADLTINIFYK